MKVKKDQPVIKYKKGETVIHYPGTQHENDVEYLSEFMFKGEKWYNIKLPNGGFMETQFIGKKKTNGI